MSINLINTLIILVILCLTLTPPTRTKEQCSQTTQSVIENHLATKTPYRVIANLNTSKYQNSGCTPLKIWAILRHGTRNPGKKEIRKAHNKLTKIRDRILDENRPHLCQEELEKLRKWEFNASEDKEKFLVAVGEDEHIELAERMQKRFPELLTNHYDQELYNFKYTATERTLRSAESFATGLFGRDGIKQIIYPEPLHKDPILRFYKLCERWKNEVDKNPDAFVEVRKFLEGREVNDAIKHVQSRTKLKNLDAKTVHLMYKICAYETAWSVQKQLSPWCSVFDEKSIRTMEFLEDLEYYWIDGYGYELTHKQACPAIVDMFDHIDPNSTLPSSTFYFTHSGTMLKLLAHLNLYKDDQHLKHTDFEKPRKWRTGKIDAFASNFAFVLFECCNEDYQVLVLHQERPVRIPGCPQDKDLCSLTQLKKALSHIVDDCNFNEICGIKQ